MKLKNFLAALAISFALVCSAQAADVNYPYGRIDLKLPPMEDPFPGFGSYYCTISQGMRTALWNPASLGKLKLSEASLSIISPMDSYNVTRTSKLNEISQTFEAGSGGTGTAGEYALFFRYPSVIGSGINTKEVEILSSLGYATTSTGINFTSALKISDWLAIGFAINNPLEANLSLAGDFPLTARLSSDLYGKSMGDMQIGSDGKIKYTFTTGGITTTYESTKAIWGSFLSQEATVPLTTLTEIRNNLKVESPYLGTIASKLGNFYAGLNMIPISATTNIDNDLRAVVNSDTEDIFLYTPNFDSKNQSELANWINDPDKYSTSDGFLRKQIRLPAGEIIADTKYRGFYSASTARLDLGMLYDLTDWFTIGYTIENLSASSLNFKGSGIASYINYRGINTAEAQNFQDLLTPGGKRTIDLITDTWVTTFEAGGYKLYLEPEKTYNLPKRTHIGFSLKKPFLIAIDYEQNQNPIIIPGSTEVVNTTFSNLNFLRLGIESQFLFLPLWTRLGFTFMLKPTVATADQSLQNNINTYFKYGVLPLKIDLGSTLNLWGLEIGDSFGIDLMPYIYLLQSDFSKIDLGKTTYFNLYLRKDAWQISYASQFDTLSTAAAYNNKPASADGKKKFEVSDAKFVNTLGVTYRF